MGKTGGGGRGGRGAVAAPGLSGAIDEFGRRNLDAGVESAVVLDRQGNVLLEKAGTEAAVEEMSRSELGLLDDNILAHNHPDGRAPSVPDFRMAAEYNNAEVHVFGRDIEGQGWHYSLARPSGGWPDSAILSDFGNTAYTEMSLPLMNRVNAGELTHAAARQIQAYDVARAMAGEFGIPFERRQYG